MLRGTQLGHFLLCVQQAMSKNHTFPCSVMVAGSQRTCDRHGFDAAVIWFASGCGNLGKTTARVDDLQRWRFQLGSVTLWVWVARPPAILCLLTKALN